MRVQPRKQGGAVDVPATVEIREEAPALFSSVFEPTRPKVQDEQLPAALIQLADAQKKTVGEWARGYRRVVAGELEIELFPHRPKLPELRHDAGACACPFCNPTPIPESDVRWREYRLIPNLAPYVPADGLHLVVSTVAHVPQAAPLSDLGQMIALSQHAGRDRPVTLHFNGIAGNSQYHRHWQLTTERIPLERMINDGSLPKVRLRKSPNIEIARYDHGLFKGFLLEGTPQAVQRWAGDLLRRLDKDPLCQGRYNLMLFPGSMGRTRLAIVARRFQGEDVEMAFGALTYGGRMFIRKGDADEALITSCKTKAHSELLDPKDLPWLPELAKAAEPAIVDLLVDKAPNVWQREGRELVIDGHGEWGLPNVLSKGGVVLPQIRVKSPELRVLLFGDSGDGGEGQARVAAALGQTYRDRKCHFAIHTGDIVYPHGIQGPDDPQVEAKVQRPYAALDRLYLALGNHDWGNSIGTGDPDAWQKVAAADDQLVMPSRYYQFGYRFGSRSADFFVVDTMVIASDDDQRAWLKTRLAASKADYKIVVGHHPPYSYGVHGSAPHLRELLLPSLQGVDVYAGGHEHDLQVLEDDSGVMFLVSGAASEARRTSSGPETQYAGTELGFMALTIGQEGLKLDVLAADGRTLHTNARPRKTLRRRIETKA